MSIVSKGQSNDDSEAVDESYLYYAMGRLGGSSSSCNSSQDPPLPPPSFLPVPFHVHHTA